MWGYKIVLLVDTFNNVVHCIVVNEKCVSSTLAKFTKLTACSSKWLHCHFSSWKYCSHSCHLHLFI